MSATIRHEVGEQALRTVDVHIEGRRAENVVHHAVHTVFVGHQHGQGFRIGAGVKSSVYRHARAFHAHHVAGGAAGGQRESQSGGKEDMRLFHFSVMYSGFVDKMSDKDIHKKRENKGLSAFF